jgi:phosphate transport system substrate-binding protein
MKGRNGVLLPALALCLSSLCCASPGESLQGAGATFPAPLYKRWFLEYYRQDPSVRVNYQAIGSGAGIRQFTEGLVAFGASDAAMSDKEIAQFKKQRGSDVLLVPMTAGSVVLCYNVEGVSKLRLSRKTYLRIFLGEINSWNDALIQADNPGIRLPRLPITVVRRADGSGTTYAFTNHLSSVGKDLKIPWTPGVGKSITWPDPKRMIGGRGNPGVTALIQQTPGAIGYLEMGFAELASLPMAILKNKAGTWVAPTDKSSRAALEGVPLPKDFRIWLPDPAGEKAYPIVTYTWLLCYKDYRKFKDPEIVDTLKKVLKYCLTDGQKLSNDLGYIPLPKDVADEVLKAVDTIKGPDPAKPKS